jgi:hypothetical protein
MTALLIALVSAIVSAGATWLLGSQDRAQAKKSLKAQQAAADAQKKIAELESVRARREFFLQFSIEVPALQISSEPTLALLPVR